MSNAPRGWRTEEERRSADALRWPVLARLPDALGDTPAVKSTQLSGPGGIEYRFDPPQAAEPAPQPRVQSPKRTGQTPHMLERSRPLGQRGFPRRESPVLPRTNPFANPRPRLVDSLAPAVRFLTMVALFTAAGVWVQTLGRQSQPSQSVETPKTAAQPAATPAKNAGDHTVPAATATGPIESHPEPGARVGRADGDDFISQNNSAAGPVPASAPSVAPPHFLISAGSHVPRVRVADSPSTATSATTDGESSDGTDEAAAVAHYPGFSMDAPKR